eukprot:8981982-Alexandrium_andersonii.AAC.1
MEAAGPAAKATAAGIKEEEKAAAEPSAVPEGCPEDRKPTKAKDKESPKVQPEPEEKKGLHEAPCEGAEA